MALVKGSLPGHFAYLTPPHLPFTTAGVPQASLLPMFPKHTQLQNNTLSIHTPDSTVLFCARYPPRSTVSSSSSASAAADSLLRNRALVTEGVGIMAGFTPRRTTEPASPTAAERRKPALDRSMSHQSSGLTRAKVTETCKVEDQGSLRYIDVLAIMFCRSMIRVGKMWQKAYNGEHNANKGPNGSHDHSPISSRVGFIGP